MRFSDIRLDFGASFLLPPLPMKLPCANILI